MATNIDEIAFNSGKSFLKKAVASAVTTANKVAETLLAVLYQQALEKVALKQMAEGGLVPLQKLMLAVNKNKEKLNTFVVKDSDYEEFLKFMEEDKILHAVCDIKMDDGKTVFYLEKDSDRMAEAFEKLNIKHGLVNEVNPKIFVNSVMEENIGILPGISDVELELFRHLSKETNSIYSIVPSKDDNKIFYNVKDREQIDNLLGKAAWIMKHPYQGDRIREQIENRIAGRKNIRDAIEGRDEFYILNGKDKSTFLHVSEKGLEIFKNGSSIKELQRSDADFDEILHEKIKEFKIPIAITKEEYENETVRESLINQQMSIFPKDYEDEIDLDKMLEIGALVQQGIDDANNHELHRKLKNRQDKMALDDEHQNPSEIDDDSITYSDFAKYEFISDLDEINAREKDINRYLNAHEYVKNHERIDIQPEAEEERSVDYLVKKADKIRDDKANEIKRQRQRNKDEKER